MATPEIDITTEEGMQQASAGKSSLSVYLQQMGKLQREAFEKVYNAVDQPCMPSCETDMDQFMMPCRQPLSFLQLFDERNREDDDIQEHTVELYPTAGAYVVPITCEYCGSNKTSQCPPNCERPKLFFRKQRPPFIPPTPSWDPITEYALPLNSQGSPNHWIGPHS